ncbi:MAG: hypothetical protein PHP50_07085 [Lachnospiraceae bacterium]|nr:hypothetical protein [Lachnospiraceae bacterium]
MKKIAIRVVVLVTTFIISMVITSTVMNQGNTDMTTEMGPATFPLMEMEVNGKAVNQLNGYARPMKISSLRDTITPIQSDRRVSFSIETFQNNINDIQYEIRSLNGERLVESAQIEEINVSDGKIPVSFVLKDLIEANQEYSMSVIVTLDTGNIIYFYTHIIMTDDYAVKEKLEFVSDFHKKTMDKDSATDIARYLEPDSTGDNTTFSKVTIHSSMKQITWGNLAVTQIGTETINIREIAAQTGSFTVNYMVSTEENGQETFYNVKEYYRVRYTPERIYLLDFERDMHQIFNEKVNNYSGNKVQLGIVNPEEISLKESDGGNIFAFTSEERLLSYNVVDQKLAVLFSFYDIENSDARTLYQNASLKILSVDETGNILFMTYGYMCRGLHEGEVGIQVNYYDGTLNTVEEQIFIPYNASTEILQKEVEQLSYVNKDGQLFVLLDGTVYCISLENKSGEIVAASLEDDSFQISADHDMLVWQDGEDLNRTTKLIVKDLTTLQEKVVAAGPGEYIKPLGFMGKDLIYGLARTTDIVRDSAGRVTFPMYTVRIQDEYEDTLMSYTQENAYITGCSIRDNQITLNRVQKTESGEYEEISDDQIMNAKEADNSTNYLDKTVTDDYETTIQIVVKNNIDGKSVKVLTPKEVLFESGREFNVEETEEQADRFYVYAKAGLMGIYMSAENAVNAADLNSGVVINDAGNYVWIKGNRSTRNQIMAITGTQVTEEKDSLAICLDTMLAFENVARNTELMLENGMSATDILAENIENAQVLDLTGCSLDAILYYVNKDIPVLANLNDGKAVLVIGFNEQNIVVMNPESGTVYKMGMNDATEWLDENGNKFITYIKNES